MAKLPAFQFYPGDWRKDMGVQSLNYFDRGVWHEMLCLMHESERRGVLVLNGQAMSEDALARLLGLDKQILTAAITTLLTSGVASREPDTSAIFCRRMVRDEKLREIRTEAGKKGGNPALLKQNPTTPVKDTSKQKPTPSSSSSSSFTASASEKEPWLSAKNAESSSGKPDPGCPGSGLESELFAGVVVESQTRQQDTAVREVFAYYLEKTQRNPKTYALTAKRRQKGRGRLMEALRMAGGNLAGAVELMKAAVDEISYSDFHMGRNPKTEGKSYCEWDEHLFHSTEQFEKWVRMANEASNREVKHA